MLKIVIIMAALSLPMSVAASDDWTGINTGMEITYQALHVIDWGQTLEIADKPTMYYEHNKTLGQFPSRGKVNSYFALQAILHPVISYLLPKGLRELWQAVTIIEISGAIAMNNSQGIGVNFKF